MKKFKFPLQPVRDLRLSEEQAAQKAYAEAVRACEEVATRLMILDKELQQAWLVLRENASQGLRADHLRHQRAWCCALEDKQKILEAELKRHQRQVDVAHGRLQLAMRRREALDRLHRKQHRLHEREMLLEDQKFLDEVATRRAWQAPAELEAA